MDCLSAIVAGGVLGYFVGRVGQKPAPAPTPEAAPATVRIADTDVLSALMNLGHKRDNAQWAVTEARKELPDAGFDELLRRSLKYLARKFFE
jgi:Holliday junction resolvasome RuvABC DNA-binding subunit